MQAVVVAGPVFEDQRCRTQLATIMAAREVSIERSGEIRFEAKLLGPTVGDRCEARIEAAAQAVDERRQRVSEIFVFSLAETVPCHHHSAAESDVVVVKGDEGTTFFPAKEVGE